MINAINIEAAKRCNARRLLTTTRKDRAMGIKPLPSQEYLRQILDYNEVTGIFTWKYNDKKLKNWNNRFNGKEAGVTRKDGYVLIGIDGIKYLSHRLAWVYIYGVEPPLYIDHINLNPNDNSIKNLRAASASQNQRNKKIYFNSCGYKGVSVSKSKWKSAIQINKTKIYLGRFNTPEEAYAAYCEAAQRYHGKYARTE